MTNLSKRISVEAFSLIEVVISIGITSFVLVALLGLFSIGEKFSQESAEQTVMPQIAARMFNVGPPPAIGSSTQGYFTYEGWPTNESAAYFRAELSGVTASPSGEPANVSTNLVLLFLKIDSPRSTYEYFSSTISYP